MKRTPTAYCFILHLLLACMIILLPITVLAQETTLTAVVPSGHILHIELTGEGAIIVDGVAYTKSADVQIERHSRPEISLQIADGYKIKTVLWNNEEVTEAFQSGRWVAPEITEDAALTVTLEKVASTPQTGDAFYPEGWFALLMFSVLGLTVCLRCSKKRIV